MEENKVMFNAAMWDDDECGEFASAWNISNYEEISKRKYGADRLGGTFMKVYVWVGANRDRIRDLILEQQEQLMLAEGVITNGDI